MSFIRHGTGRTYYSNGVYIGDVLRDNDGYFKWWPEQHCYGYLDEGFLRDLSNFLHELNREWDAQVQRELGGPNAAEAG